MSVVFRGIPLIVGIERFLAGLGILEVRVASRVVRLLPIRRELRDGDGRQDADDRHDDQQLDEGKTFTASECF